MDNKYHKNAMTDMIITFCTVNGTSKKISYEKILKEVKQTQFFSILADEVADVSNEEQLKLSLEIRR